jgi:hypothetical protein
VTPLVGEALVETMSFATGDDLALGVIDLSIVSVSIFRALRRARWL